MSFIAERIFKGAALAACVGTVIVFGSPVQAEDAAHAIANRFAEDAGSNDEQAKRRELLQTMAELKKKADEARARAETQRLTEENESRRLYEQDLLERAREEANATRRAQEEEAARAQALAEAQAKAKADEAARLAQENAVREQKLAAEAEATRRAKEAAQARARAEALAKTKAEEAAARVAQEKAAREQKLAAEARARDAAQAKERADARAKAKAEEAARVARDKASREQERAAEAEAARRAQEAAQAKARAEAQAKAAEDARIAQEQADRETKLAAQVEADRRIREAARWAAEATAREAEAELAARAPNHANHSSDLEAQELAERLREARDKYTALGGPAVQSVVKPVTATPAAIRMETRPPKPTARAEQHVTILLIMDVGKTGWRRLSKTADPMLCLHEHCFLSRGADLPAEKLSRRTAFGPAVALVKRGVSCRSSPSCIFRDVDLETAEAILQPVDLRVLRHDRRETQLIRADKTCDLIRGELVCGHTVGTTDWRAWIVPESVAKRAGPAALEMALESGLEALD